MNFAARLAAKAARPSTKSGPSAAASVSARKSGRLFAHAGGDRVDRAFGAADRHLAQVRKSARIAEHGLLQCSFHPPVDKPDRQRLVGLDPPPGEQEVLGPRRTYQFDQTARLGMAVDEAKSRRRNRKMRVGGAESQIAGERQAKPAADSDPANDRDGRAIDVHQRVEPVLDRVAIVARRGGVAVDLAEFGDVGAGAEMLPLALDKRHEHVLARLDRGADRGQRPPHRAGDRIAPVGTVEDDAGERRLEMQGYVGHGSAREGGLDAVRSILAFLRAATDGDCGAATAAVQA